MPETRSIPNNDVLADHKTDKDLKMVCMEKSDTNLKSYTSSEIDVNLNSLEINNHCSQVLNNKTENDGSHVSKIKREKKPPISLMSKDMRPRYGIPLSNKSTYYNKSVKCTVPKRKLQPVAPHLTNSCAKVVLFERNVEIKDLESKVKYLHSQIQKLENENKTLRNVQSRQERELKMFKGGVADIPSLLRSHKEEIKVYEATLSNVRRELRDCQKDLKYKNEVLLKKGSHIDKLNISLKQYEKRIRETSCEMKELKAEKIHIQDEYKLLSEATVNLKSLNEDQQKKTKEMTHQIQILEENLKAEREEKRKLLDDMQVLKQKLEELEIKVSSEEDFVPPVTVSCFQKQENSCNVSPDYVKNETNQNSKLCIEEPTESIQEDGLCYVELYDTLIQPLKQHYKDLSYPKFEECSFKDNKTSNRNLKLLPPLKQSCKRYSQNPSKDYFNKECSSPSFQCEAKYRNNRLHIESLENYFKDT